jgi:hypothetical protein
MMPQSPPGSELSKSDELSKRGEYSTPQGASSHPLVPYIDFAFIFSFLIMIVVGMMFARTGELPVPLGVLAGTEYLLTGLGGLAILSAPRIAAGVVKDKALLCGIFRNIVTEVGVVLGFIATFLTHAMWSVVVLGVAGMIAILVRMRSPAGESLAERGGDERR